MTDICETDFLNVSVLNEFDNYLTTYYDYIISNLII